MCLLKKKKANAFLKNQINNKMLNWMHNYTSGLALPLSNDLPEN